MKNTSIAMLVLALMSSPALAEDKPMDHSGQGQMDQGKMDHGQMDHAKMDHGEMKAIEAQPGTEAAGVGVLNSLDAEKSMINLTHEPMPDLGWPTMTMDLPVTKHVDLGAVKPGDKIDFKLKLGRDKQYRVIEIAPAK
ncbi:MAG: copper-binding protein [Alphaproteobacteria bacterium]|nr:copper-binding protein [Alphaproteobacteria bacterium]